MYKIGDRFINKNFGYEAMLCQIDDNVVTMIVLDEANRYSRHPAHVSDPRNMSPEELEVIRIFDFELKRS